MLALPSGWLCTIEASDEMVDAVPAWQGLGDEGKGAATLPAILAAIRARELSPVFVLVSPDGSHREFELPKERWNTKNADVAVWLAREGNLLELSAEDRKFLQDARLCFRRAEWDPWFAAWKRKVQADGSSDAPTDDSMMRWLCRESARREATGQSRNRDALRLAVKTEFGIKAAHAQRLVKAMPDSFRARRGRPTSQNPGRR